MAQFTQEVWQRYNIGHNGTDGEYERSVVGNLVQDALQRPGATTAVGRYLTGLREAVYAGRTADALRLLDEVLG